MLFKIWCWLRMSAFVVMHFAALFCPLGAPLIPCNISAECSPPSPDLHLILTDAVLEIWALSWAESQKWRVGIQESFYEELWLFWSLGSMAIIMKFMIYFSKKCPIISPQFILLASMPRAYINLASHVWAVNIVLAKLDCVFLSRSIMLR